MNKLGAKSGIAIVYQWKMKKKKKLEKVEKWMLTIHRIEYGTGCKFASLY